MLLAAPKPLCIAPTLATPQPRGFARTFANANFGNPVLLADGDRRPHVPAMHPAVLYGINRFDMLWPAARSVVACVVHMLSRRPSKRFVDEPMNALQLPRHPYKSVAGAVFGPGPNPAFSVYADAMIQSLEGFMREHEDSIQEAGFNATPTGSIGEADESAVAKPIAQVLPYKTIYRDVV